MFSELLGTAQHSPHYGHARLPPETVVVHRNAIVYDPETGRFRYSEEPSFPEGAPEAEQRRMQERLDGIVGKMPPQ